MVKVVKLSTYNVVIHDKDWNVVFERTSTFFNKVDAKKYAYDIIATTSDNSGMMKSRVKINKF